MTHVLGKFQKHGCAGALPSGNKDYRSHKWNLKFASRHTKREACLSAVSPTPTPAPRKMSVPGEQLLHLASCSLYPLSPVPKTVLDTGQISLKMFAHPPVTLQTYRCQAWPKKLNRAVECKHKRLLPLFNKNFHSLCFFFPVLWSMQVPGSIFSSIVVSSGKLMESWSRAATQSCWWHNEVKYLLLEVNRVLESSVIATA